MMEVCITPARRRSTTRRCKKAAVLRVRYLVNRKLKSIHPHTMHRLLVIAPAFAAHPKPTLRDAHHHRFNRFSLCHRGGCHRKVTIRPGNTGRQLPEEKVEQRGTPGRMFQHYSRYVRTAL